MNYEPNTTVWKVGDLVIHDMDLKEKKMLMRVERRYVNGMYATTYFFPQAHYCKLCGHKTTRFNNKIYKNDLKFLHDPRKFGIEVD